MFCGKVVIEIFCYFTYSHTKRLVVGLYTAFHYRSPANTG
jgi:hypothetical protein